MSLYVGDYVVLQFSICFEQPSAHHQKSQLYQYDLWYMSLYVGDCVVLQFSICFEQPSAHHQKSQLYQYDLWYMSLYVGYRVVCRFTCIPHDNLHTVTYTRGRIDTIDSSDDEHLVAQNM